MPTYWWTSSDLPPPPASAPPFLPTGQSVEMVQATLLCFCLLVACATASVLPDEGIEFDLQVSERQGSSCSSSAECNEGFLSTIFQCAGGSCQRIKAVQPAAVAPLRPRTQSVSPSAAATGQRYHGSYYFLHLSQRQGSSCSSSAECNEGFLSTIFRCVGGSCQRAVAVQATALAPLRERRAARLRGIAV